MLGEINELTGKIAKMQERLDKVMELSREVVRLSGEAMSAIHAKDSAKLRAKTKELGAKMKSLKAVERGFEYYSQDAHQEYVELMMLDSILSSGRVPTSKELKEKPIAYILGMMDVVGELKREALDELMKGNVEKAKSYYGFMKEIYDSTLHIRFANSLMPGFRRKQDTARIQIEGIAAELISRH